MKIENNISSIARAYESHKYHRAAIDGYVDMLCEASKKETNLASEENGLTPTLLAALNGQLEALRILVGRGGNPEKTGPSGSTALHLAASRNHLNCVSFLVNFGVNMWALDNELHTAKDVAAIEQRKEVLDYLDQVMAKQSALNTKNVQKLKEKAKLATEKRLKALRKQQLKAIKQVERDERILVKMSTNRRLLKAAHSISDIKLVGKSSQSPNFSPNSPPTGRLIGAQSIGNLTNLRLNYDPSSRLATATGNGGKTTGIVIRPKIQQTSLASSTRLSVNSSDMESAYASSISSASDYVSSSSSSSQIISLGKQSSARPKYSDLVALSNQEELGQKKSSVSSADQKANSIKSNSTIATRLRAISGVSRKVHLKRMLLSSASSSTGDLRHQNEAESHADEVKPAMVANETRLHQVATPMPGEKQTKQDANNNSDSEQVHANSSGAHIVWPLPVPGSNGAERQLSRAKSEPDIGAALGGESAEEEQEKTRDQTGAARNENDTRHHHLLTQCLSQLKMQHEAIYRQQASVESEPQGSDSDELEAPCDIPKPPFLVGLTGNLSSRGACKENQSSRQQQQLATFSQTDELIQHQLSAGQFPIRPSLIKQQQQLRANSEGKGIGVGGTKLDGRSTTVISVDSIGSADSFAKRNSTGSSISGEPFASDRSNCASSSSSVFTCSSSSSGEPQPQPEAPVQAQKLTNASALGRRCFQPQEPVSAYDLEQIDANRETIDGFLLMNGLLELSEVFVREKIDLEALMLLTEDDFRSLNILLGPRRKLTKAIELRRAQLAERQQMYIMVDTQL